MNKRLLNGLIVSGINLSPDTDDKEACVIAANELKRAGINPAQINFSIYKQSVDARKKNDIKLVYSVAARFEKPLESALDLAQAIRERRDFTVRKPEGYPDMSTPVPPFVKPVYIYDEQGNPTDLPSDILF